MEAALEACRLRLRPIVMTSIAFIAGTIPLILGHGAGRSPRRHRDHGVLRDAGRDALRSVPDAGVLRDATETGDPQEAGREDLPA